jgi:hypothetical protein
MELNLNITKARDELLKLYNKIEDGDVVNIYKREKRLFKLFKVNEEYSSNIVDSIFNLINKFPKIKKKNIKKNLSKNYKRYLYGL